MRSQEAKLMTVPEGEGGLGAAAQEEKGDCSAE